MPCLLLLLAASALGLHPIPPTEPRFNLFRARPEVEAELVWSRVDADGLGLTGRGVTICDIDAAPDIFHPMLFKADRGRFAWIDRDGDGQWSPGDAVDIDGDGVAGPDEDLAWLPYEGDAAPGLDRSRFQAGYDFLYQDANRNGVRDFGPPQFTESDPCYGEGIFLVDDVNGNERLDVGEELIGLKTSKIRALRSERVYRRGVDLIQYRVSTQTHGTLVCGVLAGGWAGRHRLTGIAPDAELLSAVAGTPDDIRWAADEKADIVLWEYGGPYSDGSREVEMTVNEMARRGVIFVAAAGNDRAPKRHIQFAGDEQHGLANRDSVGVTLQLAWRGAAPSTLRLQPPDGTPGDTPLRPGLFQMTDVSGFIAPVTASARGTSFLSLRFTSAAPIGPWSVSLPGFTGDAHAFLLFGFESPGADWVGGDGAYTVTAPGTADSAITVAAYDNAPPGDVAWFSGEGPRLDGRPVVDIAAPGVNVLSSTTGGAKFARFTGTSAAIPFVAGAAALLKQALPGLDSGWLRLLLAQGAARDSLTTNVHRWGAGRLRIHAALAEGLKHPQLFGGPLSVHVAPNPTSGPVLLSGRCPDGSDLEIRLFSVQGALVWETRTQPASGTYRALWTGLDRSGRRAPSGIYFVHVSQERNVGVGRVVWLP